MTAKSIAQPRQIRKTLEEWREEVNKLVLYAARHGGGVDAMLVLDAGGTYTAEQLARIIGSIGATVPGEVITNAEIEGGHSSDTEIEGEGSLATVIRVWLEPKEVPRED